MWFDNCLSSKLEKLKWIQFSSESEVAVSPTQRSCWSGEMLMASSVAIWWSSRDLKGLDKVWIQSVFEPLSNRWNPKRKALQKLNQRRSDDTSFEINLNRKSLKKCTSYHSVCTAELIVHERFLVHFGLPNCLFICEWKWRRTKLWKCTIKGHSNFLNAVSRHGICARTSSSRPTGQTTAVSERLMRLCGNQCAPIQKRPKTPSPLADHRLKSNVKAWNKSKIFPLIIIFVWGLILTNFSLYSSFFIQICFFFFSKSSLLWLNFLI